MDEGEMMRLIDRYIAQYVISATFLILLIVLGVESFIELFMELNAIGSFHYSVLNALCYVLMMLPLSVYQLFPMVGLLGCLLGLGHLASSHQLLIIQAAGVSKKSIGLAVIKAALLIMLVMIIIGEGLAPKLATLAYQMKQRALGHTVLDQLSQVWLREGHRFIFIEQVVNAHRLHHVVTFHFNSHHQMLSSTQASSATWEHHYWVLHWPQITVFHHDSVQTQKLKRLKLHFSLKPKAIEMDHRQPSTLSLLALRANIRYRHHHGLSARELSFIYWQRLVQPITTLVMICLSLPFVFGSLRYASLGYRMMMGVFIGFGFYLFNQFLGPFSLIYAFPPWLAAILPTALVTFFTVWMMQHTK